MLPVHRRGRRHQERIRLRAAGRLLAVVFLAAGVAGCVIDRDFRPGPAHLATALAPDHPPAAPDSLLLVSYNIQYGEDLDQALADLRRAGLDQPDILLLQEMTPAGVESLARALSLGYVYHPASVHPHHQRLFGNAVLSRWPITAERLLVLPHPHPWSGHRRIAVSCDLDIAGRHVRAVSVHLATAVLDDAARLDQATAILDSLVADHPGPVIVGGDFNTAAAPALAALRKTYRRRARLLPVRLPDGCTIRWNYGRPLGAGCRLDHVFLRGLRAGAAGIERAATASDHFPIWARIGWQDRP